MQQKTTDIIKRITKDLRNKGQRFTEPRQKVMNALLENKKPITAYKIVEQMGDVKPMTVYRALDFLVEQGLAHRIESLNAYAACSDNHCHHTDSQYLICSKCGAIEELHNHTIDDFIITQLKKSGFIVKSKKLEINGICKKCS